ncbi:hypothetical protein [Parvibaculum sp.]|uniref:hypothetical protein n=2 Tax=Alphaproteobacteria TaxID=28211 RepID=UPI0019C87CC6|nr:hypothetical protein [Parvibaculum sp.]MBA4228765.1 hypothetical protein [Hyphomonas sp.]MDX5365141.1 hypothetical protein [Alphaproteobacteria bacterium]MBC7102625.1 hypothetical protein [Parvibaculum sp.]MBO6669777.1 hypothetical protein [Parvibaculum sp.]MBO6693401.1 hypothetical protein [Parvibaculum sp.]
MELDKFPTTAYEYMMVKLVRIFVFALLAAFAVGSGAHAMSTTTMSIKMALADGGAMDMADCQGCGSDGDGDDGGLSCSMVCVTPLLASLSPEGSVPLVTGISPSVRAFYDLAGRTGPPEPYPPRTLI